MMFTVVHNVLTAFYIFESFYSLFVIFCYVLLNNHSLSFFRSLKMSNLQFTSHISVVLKGQQGALSQNEANELAHIVTLVPY